MYDAAVIVKEAAMPFIKYEDFDGMRGFLDLLFIDFYGFVASTTTPLSQLSF